MFDDKSAMRNSINCTRASQSKGFLNLLAITLTILRRPIACVKGDVTLAIYNSDLVDELKAMKEASWLSYMFDS